MTVTDSPLTIAPRRRLLDRLPVRLNPTAVRETAWLAGGFGTKLVINLGTLFYLTHTLTVAGTGTFFALISLLACIVPFVQLGNYDLTVRDIARRADPQQVAGRALRSSAAAFCFVLPVVAALHHFVAPGVGWVPFLMVAAGELLVIRVISNVQAVATGFRQHYVTAVSDLLLGSSRLGAMYVAYRLGAGLDVVLVLYAFTALPAAVATYAWLLRRIGRPHLRGRPIFTGVADHLRMVVAWFAEMAVQQGDKPLLMTLAGPDQTGIYGTASKLFGVMLVPIDVLTQVFRPRISQAYGDGEAHGRRLARLMSLCLGGCGLLTGLGLFAAAFLAPRIAPKLTQSKYADVRVALMYLALVPPIYGLQRASVVSAIARGAVGAYAKAIAIGAVLGVGTLVLLAHRFGWLGACIATIVYMGVSCLTTWLFARQGGGPAADRSQPRYRTRPFGQPAARRRT